MACPNLKGIEKQLKTGVDFSLTDNKYLKSTGLLLYLNTTVNPS